ncbi:Protein of unknown function [Streptomyces sp. DvalAA-14]|uniref:DUF2637 domain-containing protein n=1 Tax=unclassified Streptomyces TaxID=2593676 RepID=UPI00081B6293|nr:MULTISPECIES: DUF2637 domain-containing protein [unclassified Streptomyces]MYS19723.1 DUF2637 domain-containing protein [Streptomyces sp. SID4948]SCD51550.1 Protein of unknown function [Streptomyces sp. DvalAA-14]
MNRTAKALLVAALVVVVGMAFRVSWNALRDIASTVGADSTASLLYPFVVDGLMALALVATLVLTGPDRRFALRVLAGYTAASLVLNYVHGLVPALHAHAAGRLHLVDYAPANWVLVLLATSLPVGSIFFGSDLVAKVLHHRPAPITDQDQTIPSTVNRLGPDLRESTPTTLPAPAAPLVPESTGTAPLPAPAVAAPSGPRRPTGPVPKVARTPRPTRTAEQLLSEARQATADWSDDALTGEAIRKAVHTSSANGRMLRDALRSERTAPTPLHLVDTDQRADSATAL